MASQQVPTEMIAAAMNRFGSPDVVHTERLPVPALGKKDILVHVAIAGVGAWDPELVSGEFQDVKVRFPRVIGSDGAGTVVAIGSGVKRFQVGDRVYGSGFGNPKGGFFAEYAAIDEKSIAPIPDALTFDQAGALAVSGITALQGLDQLDLDPGDRIIIFGASGGVGHIALQLAKRLGLEVFAVASKRDGVHLAQRLGADRVAEGHSRTLVHQLRDFAPQGYDGALVFAGGNGWAEPLDLVNPRCAVAWPNGVQPTPAVPRRVKRKVYDAKVSPAAFARLNELVDRGPFEVVVAKTYPLDATSRALRDVRRHHVGKLAIAISLH